MDGITPAQRHQAGLVLRRAIAIDGARRDAEAVLHRQRDSGGEVFLQLGDGDQHVAVRVGVIEVESREEMAALGHGEADVTLAIAEEVGVLEFHYGRRAGEEGEVPAGADHVLLQGLGRFPRALQQAYAARSGPSHQVDGGGDHARMRPGGEADGEIAHAAFGPAGEVDFHRHGLALDDAAPARRSDRTSWSAWATTRRRRMRSRRARLERRAPRPRGLRARARRPPGRTRRRRPAGRGVLYSFCMEASRFISQTPGPRNRKTSGR